MSFVDYQEKLNGTEKNLPPQARAVLPSDTLVSMLEEIGDARDLTLGEEGELCEVVRQIITRELPPGKFEDALRERLSEDSREKIPGIAAAVNEQIFSKLLPALGIAVPAVSASPSAAPGAGRGGAAGANPAPFETKPSDWAPPPLSEPEPPPLVPAAPPERIFPPVPASWHAAKPAVAAAPLRSAVPKTVIAPENAHLEALLKIAAGSGHSENELRGHFDRLPAELQKAIVSTESAKNIEAIGRKYRLHIDKIGMLGTETGLVLLGLTHPSQFVGRLRAALGASDEIILPVAKEVNAAVFLPVRAALRKIYDEEPIAVIGGTGKSGPAEPAAAAPLPPRITQSIPAASAPAETAAPRPGEPARPEAEETPTRDELLREIEQPAPAVYAAAGNPAEKRPAPPRVPPPAGAPVPQNKFTKAIDAEIRSALSGAGGSGSARPDPGTMPPPPPPPPATAFVPGASGKEAAPAAFHIPPAPKAPAAPPAPPAVPPPPPPLVAEKLGGAVKASREESRYRIDPYREPVE